MPLRLVASNTLPPAPPPPTIPILSTPCPHGYKFSGNCTICTPPPRYVPMLGLR